MTDKLIEAAQIVISEFGTSSDGLLALYQALKDHRSQQSPPAAIWVHTGDLEQIMTTRTRGVIGWPDAGTDGDRTPLYTSPAPSESEAKDAARYRFLLSMPWTLTADAEEATWRIHIPKVAAAGSDEPQQFIDAAIAKGGDHA